jgi:hypothetical protein
LTQEIGVSKIKPALLKVLGLPSRCLLRLKKSEVRRLLPFPKLPECLSTLQRLSVTP